MKKNKKVKGEVVQDTFQTFTWVWKNWRASFFAGCTLIIMATLIDCTAVIKLDFIPLRGTIIILDIIALVCFIGTIINNLLIKADKEISENK